MYVNERGTVSGGESYPFYFIMMTKGTQSAKPTLVPVTIGTEGFPFQSTGLTGFTCVVLFNPHTTLWLEYCHYLHFIGKGAEAQKCEVSQP